MKLGRLLKVLKSFIPETLPQGKSQFDVWATDIIELSGLPDNDSMRFALASMILQLRTTRGRFFGRFAKAEFVREMRLGAASEVASFVMQDVKAKQKARAEEEAKAASAKQVAHESTG